MDTNDFFVEPDIWDLLDKVRDIAAEYGTELLPEIHEHYSIQFKIADHDYYVYDFCSSNGDALYSLQFQNRAFGQVVKDEPNEAIYDARHP